MSNASTNEDKARLLAVRQPHAGDWLLAPPITSVGLRMSNEEITLAVGLRLGCNLCQPHTFPCGKLVDARGLHGLACHKSAGRITRYSSLNDAIWRAMRKAGIHSTKEQLGMLRENRKRPDGVTLIPWSRGKCLECDVTVPDFYAASHVNETSTKSAAVADRAAELKKTKYQSLCQTHLFVPAAIETSGVINHEAMEFLQDLGRRMEEETGDNKETAYLLQIIFVMIQRGNATSFAGTLQPPNE